MNIETKRYKLTSTQWGDTAIHDKLNKTTHLTNLHNLPPVNQLAAMHEADVDEAISAAVEQANRRLGR